MGWWAVEGDRDREGVKSCATVTSATVSNSCVVLIALVLIAFLLSFASDCPRADCLAWC